MALLLVGESLTLCPASPRRYGPYSPSRLDQPAPDGVALHGLRSPPFRVRRDDRPRLPRAPRRRRAGRPARPPPRPRRGRAGPARAGRRARPAAAAARRHAAGPAAAPRLARPPLVRRAARRLPGPGHVARRL